MKTFIITYNTGIGKPYKEIAVQAENIVDAENAAISKLGNIRIISVRG